MDYFCLRYKAANVYFIGPDFHQTEKQQKKIHTHLRTPYTHDIPTSLSHRLTIELFIWYVMRIKFVFL